MMAVGFRGTRVHCRLLGLPGAAEQRTAPATGMEARRFEARRDARQPGEIGRPKSRLYAVSAHGTDIVVV